MGRLTTYEGRAQASPRPSCFDRADKTARSGDASACGKRRARRPEPRVMGAGFRAVGVTGLPAVLGQTGPQVEFLETSIGTRGSTADRREIVRTTAYRPGQAARRVRTRPRRGKPRHGGIRMPERWQISLGVVAALVMACVAVPASAGVPDVSASFYVPQTGTVAAPTEGA